MMIEQKGKHDNDDNDDDSNDEDEKWRESYIYFENSECLLER